MKEINSQDLRVGYHYVFYETDLSDSGYKYMNIFQLTDDDDIILVIERYRLWNNITISDYCIFNDVPDERSLAICSEENIVRTIFELTSEEYYRQVILEVL